MISLSQGSERLKISAPCLASKWVIHGLHSGVTAHKN